HHPAGHQRQRHLHDPLAEPLARHPPGPALLPGGLRRPHRQPGDAGGPGAARERGAGGQRRLVHPCVRHGGAAAARRRGLAPRPADRRLVPALRRAAALHRAADAGSLARGVGAAQRADGPDRGQLHQRPDREALRPRPAGGRVRAGGRAGADGGLPPADAPGHAERLRAGDAERRHDHRDGGHGRLALDAGGNRHRRGGDGAADGLADRQHLRLGRLQRDLHLREHRRGAGGDELHRRAAHRPGPARRRAAPRAARGDPLRGRALRLRAGERRVGGAGPPHPSGRARRARGPLRRRQVHHGEPAARLLPAGGRTDHRGRAGRRGGDAGIAPRRGGRRHPGHGAAAPFHPRQHPLRPAGGDGGRDRGGGGARGGGRLHPRVARLARPRGLRRPRGRARRQALGRAAPARGHRPRAVEGRAHPGAGRGDKRAGLGSRGGDPGAALLLDGGQDGDRHRAPPVHHRAHGPAGGAGRGPHPGGRLARGAAAPRRRVRAAVAAAERRLRPRRGAV
ncbi:MAG: Efflux ABC transporter, permease/ATP-binding protein Atu2242, partial [uncultured Acetobacteraceae bacterium]